MVKEYTRQGASLNAKDKDGKTPLHYAAGRGYASYPDIVRYLIEKGADVNIQDNNNETPLEVALEKGNLEIADFLQSAQHRTRHKRHKQHHRKHHQHFQREEYLHLGIGISSHRSIAKEAKNSLQNDKIGYNKGGATSGTSKPSSWINDLCGWVKSSVGGLSGSRAALPEENLNTKSSISQLMDVNGTVMLLDVLARKVTGQKYRPAAKEEKWLYKER